MLYTFSCNWIGSKTHPVQISHRNYQAFSTVGTVIQSGEGDTIVANARDCSMPTNWLDILF